MTFFIKSFWGGVSFHKNELNEATVLDLVINQRILNSLAMLFVSISLQTTYDNHHGDTGIQVGRVWGNVSGLWSRGLLSIEEIIHLSSSSIFKFVKCFTEM